MNTFWVIERFENGKSAGYWDGGSSRSFIADIEKAIHFCRRQDAFWATRGWHWGDTQITEHLYLATPGPHTENQLPTSEICKHCELEIFPDAFFGWCRFGSPACAKNPDGHKPMGAAPTPEP